MKTWEKALAKLPKEAGFRSELHFSSSFFTLVVGPVHEKKQHNKSAEPWHFAGRFMRADSFEILLAFRVIGKGQHTVFVSIPYLPFLESKLVLRGTLFLWRIRRTKMAHGRNRQREERSCQEETVGGGLQSISLPSSSIVVTLIMSFNSSTSKNDTSKDRLLSG